MGRRIAGYEIPDSLNDPTPAQAEGSMLKRELEAQLDALRRDPSLSESGKRTMIARAWQAFKPDFDRLQQRERAEYATAVKTRQHKLVGLQLSDDPAAISRFNDAMDRAEALPAGGPSETERTQLETEAAKLLRRAELAGDDILARAVLCVAIERNLGSVVEAYKQHNPDDAELVDGYFELRKYDPETSMIGYYTWQVRVPQEISGLGMDERGIAEVAEQSVFDGSTGATAPAPQLTNADRVGWGL